MIVYECTLSVFIELKFVRDWVSAKLGD